MSAGGGSSLGWGLPISRKGEVLDRGQEGAQGMVARSAWAHLGPWPSACRKAGSSLTSSACAQAGVGLGCSLLGPGHEGGPCVDLSSSGAGRPAGQW